MGTRAAPGLQEIDIPGTAGRTRSNMTFNPDPGCDSRTGAGCTIRSLGGYTEITTTRGTGREGIDERQFRFGLRLSF